MAPLMIIGSVPLYNIMAVVVLSFTKPGQNGMSPELIKKTLKGICDQSDHSGNSGRCIVVSFTASDANNPDKDGFQSWRSDNTSRTDGNGRCL